MSLRRARPQPAPVTVPGDPGLDPGPATRGEPIAGRYRLGAPIGRGGMADVVEAFDEALRRPVAIKWLRREFTKDRDLRTRFAREARAGARIQHPNVVAIYDVGEHDGVPFFVMERLPGRTLHDELGHGPVPAARVRTLASEILGALGAAHRLGILHRDIKPANVLLDEHGHAKVGDFGIAHVSDDVHHTSTGLVLGTLSYLAPERLIGAPATPAADLYAVGVVLFEAATGRPAFRADSPLALTRAVADDVPAFTADERRRLDSLLVAAVQRALAKDPSGRFETADGMLRAITAGDATAVVAPTLPVSTAGPATRRMTPAPSAAPGRTRPHPASHRPPGPGADGTAPRRARRASRAVVLVIVVVLGAAGVGVAIAARSASSTPGPAVTTPSTTVGSGSVPERLGPALDALDRSIDR